MTVLVQTHPPTLSQAQQAVATLLAYLGYDSAEPGLAETPDRVVRSLLELTAGQHQDPASHLARVFASEGEHHDEVIALTGISFTSLCEHHMQAFTGTATVAYAPAPGAPVVGLSKLARVVDVYARRLTMQERITQQITDALSEHLDTVGTAAILSGRHACLGLRGALKPGAVMVTSSLTGIFRTDQAARAELFALRAEGGS